MFSKIDLLSSGFDRLPSASSRQVCVVDFYLVQLEQLVQNKDGELADYPDWEFWRHSACLVDLLVLLRQPLSSLQY